ncbi:unnamed protein product [Closterium sp. Yama58-4]|nr:unnamed protein product [Closterium sp. Yama58-4]
MVVVMGGECLVDLLQRGVPWWEAHVISPLLHALDQQQYLPTPPTAAAAAAAATAATESPPTSPTAAPAPAAAAAAPPPPPATPASFPATATTAAAAGPKWNRRGGKGREERGEGGAARVWAGAVPEAEGAARSERQGDMEGTCCGASEDREVHGLGERGRWIGGGREVHGWGERAA